MAAIDIGAAATTRGTHISGGYTQISLDNPANATGSIDTIEVYAVVNMGGLKVGTMFFISGTTYECRAVESIGTVTSGAKRTFTGLDMAVETGDFLAAYWSSGNIYYDYSGGAGVPYNSGDELFAEEQNSFTANTSDIQSLYGTGEEAAAGEEKGPISSTVYIGNLVSATRELAADRDSLVYIGNLVSAFKSRGITKTAIVRIGNLVSATRKLAADRDSLVRIGTLVSASRALVMSRASLVLIGNLVSATRKLVAARASSVLIGVRTIATRALVAARSSSILIGNLVSASRLMGVWFSPTGHNDPDTAWANETNAYDGNVATYAQSGGASGTPLELTISATNCMALRFYASIAGAGNKAIDLDAYYGGAWNDVYNGVLTENTWVTKPLGGFYSVTKARVAFSADIFGSARLYEFDFRGGGWHRASSVLIGTLVAATRAIAFNRASTVLIGLLVSASRVWGAVRTATVRIGVVASATVSYVLLLFRELIVNLYSRNVTLNLYARSIIIGLYKRTATLNLYARSTIITLARRAATLILKVRRR